jgi:hypothetical protein
MPSFVTLGLLDLNTGNPAQVKICNKCTMDFYQSVLVRQKERAAESKVPQASAPATRQ